MLSAILLVFISACNAQQPIQNIGHDETSIPVMSPDQPEKRYDSPTYWVENVPINVPDSTNINSPDISNINFPDMSNYNVPDISNMNFPDLSYMNVPDISNVNFPDMSNINLADMPYGNYDGPQGGQITPHFDLKLPEHDSQKVKAILTVLEFLTKSVQENPQNVHPLKSPDFLVSSNLSEVFGKLNLTNENDIKHSVTHLANRDRSLRNDTDRLVEQLNLIYLHLASDESDNELNVQNAYRYGMSLILRFLFEFYRIFRKMSSQPTHPQLRITHGDIYSISYDKALVVMKDKRNYTPLEISAPIKRSADIFKSIIYESVAIVQGKCSAFDPNWRCILVFLANLISETTNCSNVWYHALMHMLALEKIGTRDCFVYKIAILDKFKELSKFENIFDFVIDMVEEYREVGRVQLSAEAIMFSMLADLQENGVLNCMSIDSSCN